MTVTKKPELGKWGCWRFFAADPKIRPYLPPTTTLNLNSLRHYLNQYKEVYIKPVAGYGGRGIIKAWKTANGFAFVHERGAAIHAATVADLLQKIKQRARPGITYIVQKAIHLPKIQGRPFDIRLMMMRHGGKWEYVGMLAKVAGQKSIITNIARGKGYVLSIDQALQQSLGWQPSQIAAVKQEMIQVGHQVVHRFDAYKHYWQIGLDLGVDQQGKVWIIEENTGPAHSLFAKLPDKTMFRKIKEITAKIRGSRSTNQTHTKTTATVQPTRRTVKKTNNSAQTASQNQTQPRHRTGKRPLPKTIKPHTQVTWQFSDAPRQRITLRPNTTNIPISKS